MTDYKAIMREVRKTLLVKVDCKRCGKELQKTSPSQKYCGSKRDKVGCSWEVRDEKFRKIIDRQIRLRFKILSRDKFTCQYCGSSAPEVVLEVDHIIPKSKGGGNEETNLVTACKKCNLGKSNTTIKH